LQHSASTNCTTACPLLGNIPYYFTLHFLRHISVQIKIQCKIIKYIFCLTHECSSLVINNYIHQYQQACQLKHTSGYTIIIGCSCYIFELNWFVVLTPNGQNLGCTSIAFSKWNEDLQSYSRIISHTQNYLRCWTFSNSKQLLPLHETVTTLNKINTYAITMITNKTKFLKVMFSSQYAQDQYIKSLNTVQCYTTFNTLNNDTKCNKNRSSICSHWGPRQQCVQTT
jgi:hypothetical protein